jgi:hypothetical protein
MIGGQEKIDGFLEASRGIRIRALLILGLGFGTTGFHPGFVARGVWGRSTGGSRKGERCDRKAAPPVTSARK